MSVFFSLHLTSSSFPSISSNFSYFLTFHSLLSFLISTSFNTNLINSLNNHTTKNKHTLSPWSTNTDDPLSFLSPFFCQAPRHCWGHFRKTGVPCGCWGATGTTSRPWGRYCRHVPLPRHPPLVFSSCALKQMPSTSSPMWVACCLNRVTQQVSRKCWIIVFSVSLIKYLNAMCVCRWYRWLRLCVVGVGLCF